jgi:hypothetical protein
MGHGSPDWWGEGFEVGTNYISMVVSMEDTILALRMGLDASYNPFIISQPHKYTYIGLVFLRKFPRAFGRGIRITCYHSRVDCLQENHIREVSLTYVIPE